MTPEQAATDLGRLRGLLGWMRACGHSCEEESAALDRISAALETAASVRVELDNWKAMMRRFVPSNREPDRCRNCDRLYIDHYSGPFAEQDTAYCSKYAVPTKPKGATDGT